MFDWKSGESGYLMSIFPDDSHAIDFILDESLVKKIYESWDESVYGGLVDYGGGVRAITARMLMSAGTDFLTTIKNIGDVRAGQILDDVSVALEEVPYGGGL